MTAPCPITELCALALKSVLKSTTTPPNPTSRPSAFWKVILSSLNQKCAIAIVNKGTVALRTEAVAESIVCSPQEIEVLRKEYGRDLLIVTPGIRPLWAAAQDQKRIMTPAEAVAKGADYLVIGRPVTGAPEPNEAFLRIVGELA